MGIKHRADSGFRMFRVFSKLCLGGQVGSSEMPYVSYPRPLYVILKTTDLPRRMEYKNFIDNLSQNNANYNNPEQAITTANLCDTISRDINTDSQRLFTNFCKTKMTQVTKAECLMFV